MSAQLPPAVIVKELAVQCKICNKRFKNKFNHQVHLRVHSGVKPFRCGVCKKSFNIKSNRNRHLSIHSAETPYVCQEQRRGNTGRCVSEEDSSKAKRKNVVKHEMGGEEGDEAAVGPSTSGSGANQNKTNANIRSRSRRNSHTESESEEDSTEPKGKLADSKSKVNC